MAAEVSTSPPATATATALSSSRSSSSMDGLEVGDHFRSILSSYLGLTFGLFLGLLPESAASYVPSLQSRNRILAMKLFEAEDQLRQLRSRRKEDAKANARVAEIFASHRNRWQQEEKRLLARIDAAEGEIAELRARIGEMESSEAEMRAAVERLEREVAEREEMLDFMARKVEARVGGRGGDGFAEKEVVVGSEDSGARVVGISSSSSSSAAAPEEEEEEENESGVAAGFGGGDFSRVRDGGLDPVLEECLSERNYGELEEMAAALFAHQNGLGREFMAPPMPPTVVDSKVWTDRLKGWQDMQHDSHGSQNNVKQFVSRRECPWKVNGESSGVSSKLKMLELELCNLEKTGKGNSSKLPSLLRKQAKRYQSLSVKIDDLCRRMQASDPCDANLSPEFRTQRQTEFLLEAFQLQHRATETRQKLGTLQAEEAKSYLGDELTAQAKLTAKKCLESIRNNFKEIQRNLEIWLARIMGDLEGILARDGASRVRDYYLSPYPFVR